MESKTRTTQGRKKGAAKKTSVKPTKKTAPAMPPPDEISVSVPMPTALFPGLKKPIILQAFGDGMKNAGICDGDYLVFETDIRAKDEDVVVAMIDGRKVCRRVCDETGVPPLLLFQKEKEYLQSLPSEKIIDSYLVHDRQTTVRKDSMVTYNKCRYSVPAEYIGKPVRLLVNNDTLQIYYSTALIAVHELSAKRLNYKPEHYKQLLSGSIRSEDAIEELAEKNLQQMDLLL